MELIRHIAKHFRDLHFGGNWTCSNMRDNLNGVTWQQATTQVHSLNTIATLTYHTHYYVRAVLAVLQGGVLNASDKLSFDHPPIVCAEDWSRMQQQYWDDVEAFAQLVEQMPESKLWETFTDDKYGNYYRNIQGIIEHTHYHLGQIAAIKKMLAEGVAAV